MRDARKGPAAVACAAFLQACAAPAQPPEVPALLVQPDARTRAELQEAVRSEFGGSPVPLADDALTASPELVIEHQRPVDAEGRLLNGRELGRPEIFRLVRAESRCVLVHERTGRRFVLTSANCRGL